MKRESQGHYVTVITVGESAQAFVPAPLPPRPPTILVRDLPEFFAQPGQYLGMPNDLPAVVFETQRAE